MSRRSLISAIAIVVLLLLTIGTGVALLLRYEPRHHRLAEVSPSVERQKESTEFTQHFTEMISEISQPEWSQTFTDKQINSFLSEGFVKTGMAEKLLPEEISEPRVTFEEDVMRLSFRYQTQLLSTVVSVDLKTWVTAGEANALALQIRGIHAGAMPFKAQWLLERISEIARQHEIDVSWYRHEGHPVAILRFQANQPKPTLKLRTVKIKPGELTVHGANSDRRTAVMNIPSPPEEHKQ